MSRTIHWINKEALIKASEILLNGGIIIYPTDTLYGFGCDAKNEKAINRINLLKNRTEWFQNSIMNFQKYQNCQQL